MPNVWWAFAVVAYHLTMVETLRVPIDNTIPRRDTSGHIIDAHDGMIAHYNGEWWWYGTAYGPCNNHNDPCHPLPNYTACGWKDQNFAAYSSTDFQTWALRTPSLLDPTTRPKGVYFRPKVLYNRRTSQYILWFNIVYEYQESFNHSLSVYGVATARDPAGPFKFHSQNVSLKYPRNGDFALFIDDDKDETAYIMYNAYDDNFSMSVERLTEDYLGTTHENLGFFAGPVEAPIMFKQNGIYYGATGHLCCFCPQGSNAKVYRSHKAIGPYEETHVDLNPSPGITAQQDYLIPLVRVNPTDPHYLWIGDRWGSAPDHLKGHDYQAWLPVYVVNGVLQPLKWVNNWVANF